MERLTQRIDGDVLLTSPKYPCGAESDSTPEEQWKDEISCTLVGCRGCKNFNGTEYYQANVKKGVAMWAKKELEGMR